MKTAIFPFNTDEAFTETLKHLEDFNIFPENNEKTKLDETTIKIMNTIKEYISFEVQHYEILYNFYTYYYEGNVEQSRSDGSVFFVGEMKDIFSPLVGYLQLYPFICHSILVQENIIVNMKSQITRIDFGNSSCHTLRLILGLIEKAVNNASYNMIFIKVLNNLLNSYLTKTKFKKSEISDFLKYEANVNESNNLPDSFFFDSLSSIAQHVPKFIGLISKLQKYSNMVPNIDPNTTQRISKIEKKNELIILELDRISEQSSLTYKNLLSYYSKGLKMVDDNRIILTFKANKIKLETTSFTNKIKDKGLREYILMDNKLIEYNKEKESKFFGIFKKVICSKDFIFGSETIISTQIPSYISNARIVDERNIIHIVGKRYNFILSFENTDEKDKTVIEINKVLCKYFNYE